MKRTEIKERRTRNTKLYENQDHSFTREIYLEAVHYEDEAGTWKEMEDTLEEAAEELPEESVEKAADLPETGKAPKPEHETGKTPESGDVPEPEHETGEASETVHGAEEKEKDFVNRKGSWKVRFSGNYKEKNAVTLSRGNHRVSWALEGAQKVKAVRESPEKLRYPGLLPGVDCAVRTFGEKVKEDLVLLSPESPAEFSYRYELKNLEAVHTGCSVDFVNETGEEMFHLTAPLMKDAAGESSGSIAVALEKEADFLRIRLLPDPEWLKAPQRKYPVVIDPVITSPLEKEQIQDAHVDSLNCGDNYGNFSILKTRGGDTIQRSFLKFALPELESAEMVIRAQFGIGVLTQSTSARTVQIHRVVQDWDSRTINWNNKPVYEEIIQDSCTYTASKDRWLAFDITRMVKDWYGNGSNFGLMLKDDYELAGYTEFLASDCMEEYREARPRIDVTYVNYAGLEDYWTYHTQEAGRAGTVHVNDYNGNLVLVRPLAATSGSRMPAEVSLVYNTTARKQNIGYGKGFRLNYHQTLVSRTIGDTAYYMHTDGDGTNHYFCCDEKKNWKDESGLGLTLMVNTGGTEPLVIKDKEENCMVFDSSGNLVKIRDKNGNTLTVTYGSGRITKITDGAGREILFTYYKDEAGNPANLEEVTDPAGRKTVLTYTAGQIAHILDSDGSDSSYTYNSALNLLFKAKGPDDRMMRYEYTDTKPYRVTNIREFGGSEEGNRLDLTYGYNSTTFTDRKGRKETFRFNDQGNLLYVHDGFGHAAGSRFHTEKGKENLLKNTAKLQENTVQLLKDPIIEAGARGWSAKSAASSAVEAKVNPDPANAKVGSHSLEIDCREETEAMYWTQNVPVKKGETYTFSMYVKALVESVGSDGRCFVRLRYFDKDAKVHSVDSEAVVKSTTGFRQLHASCTVPADSARDYVAVYLYLHHVKGKLYGDMAQLEPGNVPGRCSLIDNGDFHLGKTSGFTGTGTPADGLVTVGDAVEVPVQYAMMVTKTTAVLRKAPDPAAAQTSSAAKGAHLASAFFLTGTDGNTWYRVKTEGGVWGYIPGGDVLAYLPNGDTITGGVVVPEKTLAVLRSGASEGAAAVTSYVTRGAGVAIRSKTTAADGRVWYRVALQSDTSRYSGYLPAEEVIRLAENNARGKTKGTGAYYNRPVRGSAAGSFGAEIPVSIRGVLYRTGGEAWYAVLKGKEYVLLPEESVEVLEAPVFVSRTTTVVKEKIGGLDGNILKLVGEASTDKKLTKTLDLVGKAGDTYMVNAWGRGWALPETDRDRARRFGVEVTFVSSVSGTADDVHYMKFSPDITDWQFLMEACVAKIPYKEIKVAYTYSHNANLAFFDGLALFREEFGQTYTYDEKNNLVSVTDAQKQSRKFEYNASEDLTGVVDAKGNKFKFTYDTHHNVTGGESAEGVLYKLEYDDRGNVRKSGCAEPETPENGTWITRGMTGDGNHVQSVTDAAGNRVSYVWDTQKDLLTAMTDARKNVLLYGYDGEDRLTSVKQIVTDAQGTREVVENTYTYEQDRLSAISHNGFSYGFGCDAFGNTINASIAGTEVVSYEYETGNGNLLKTVYGNGDYIRYTYDGQDRLLQSYYKNASEPAEQKLNGYVYDKHGNLVQVTADTAGKTYRLYYDFLDRLMRVADEQGTAYEYTYDVNNNMVNMIHSSGTSAAETSYTYDKDSREVTVRPAETFARTTKYDTLGRVMQQTWNTAAPFYTRYTYFNYGVNRYSLPETITNGSATIVYAYDPNGNITTITDSTGTSSFVYDERSQMIRENNHVLDQTLTYTYDLGGNLTKVEEYAFTTEAELPEEPLRTEEGTYDAVWKDKLLNWNGTAMTYDAVGNMLTKGTTSFTWTQGRKLAAVNNGRDIRYAYDHTGARVKKTVDGVTTEYRMAGDLLLSEKTGTQTYWYRYDSAANLISVTIKGQIYFYIRNVQNDIIGLVDKNGDVVVKYTYDSWGKPLSITGPLADTVGVQNPFRYRGYYYDSETGLYYLKTRYYDPEIRRFISADDLGVLGVQKDLYDKNLYVYCDNNPLDRMDGNGHFWITATFVGLVMKNVVAPMLVGVITQYLGDVIGNILQKKEGWDVFGITSTKGEYLSAAVTAVIPGKGMGAALIRNGVTEVICSKENGVNKENLDEAARRIVVGTSLDWGFEKGSDIITKYIGSKGPKNYSSYAGKMYKKNPQITSSGIVRNMQRSIRWRSRLSKGIGWGMNVTRILLPV